MKNKASKKIKWLTIVILLLFLIPMGMDFVKGFQAGWRSISWQEEMAVSDEGAHSLKSMQSYFVSLESTDNRETARLLNDGVMFSPYEESGYLLSPESEDKPLGLYLVELLLSLTAIVMLIWFVILLFRFALGLSHQQIMTTKNIRRLRKLAIVLGAFSLSQYLVHVIEVLYLRSHLALEGYSIALKSPPGYLVVALIILVVAEILTIGHNLQQEQELTI